MKVLAVTCYTGGEELCHMTDHCLRSLQDCVPKTVEMEISVTAQGAALSTLTEMSASYLHVSEKNISFAYGMNRAIELAVKCEVQPDYVLCFNNDLQFPNRGWLRKLVDVAEQLPNRVVVPATDKAAIRVQPGPTSQLSEDVQEMSAYCWLIPFEWCKMLKERYGFWLFCEEFAPAYGEDNYTAFLLSKHYGPKVFRFVPRSWVKHLKGRTASSVKCNRAKTSALLVAKLRAELRYGPRGDLQKWARRYIAILTKKR